MKRLLIILLLSMNLLFSCTTSSNVTTLSGDSEEIIDSQILVYIQGEVNNPGLYYLPSNNILNDLIILSGGFTDNADITGINLTKELKDKDMVIIPSINSESTNTLVNINSADKTVLMTLPGIGESKALKIIEYRESNGYFSSIEDIKNVSGIGDSIFEKIKEYITV